MEKNAKIIKKQVDLFLFLCYNTYATEKKLKKIQKSIAKIKNLGYTYIVMYFDGLVAQLVRAHA